MATIKREDAFKKRFAWTFPCGHETDWEEYTWENYKSLAPTHCPKCGRSADDTPAGESSIPASVGFPEGVKDSF